MKLNLDRRDREKKHTCSVDEEQKKQKNRRVKCGG